MVMQTFQTKKDWDKTLQVYEYMEDYRHNYDLIYTKEFIHMLYHATRNKTLYIEPDYGQTLYKLLMKSDDNIVQELAGRIVLFNISNEQVPTNGIVFIENYDDTLLSYINKHDLTVLMRIEVDKFNELRGQISSDYHEVTLGTLLVNALTSFRGDSNYIWKMLSKPNYSVDHDPINKRPMIMYRQNRTQDSYGSKLKGFRNSLRQRAISVLQKNFRHI